MVLSIHSAATVIKRSRSLYEMYILRTTYVSAMTFVEISHALRDEDSEHGDDDYDNIARAETRSIGRGICAMGTQKDTSESESRGTIYATTYRKLYWREEREGVGQVVS
jgi:hypothetical protein